MDNSSANPSKTRRRVELTAIVLFAILLLASVIFWVIPELNKMNNSNTNTVANVNAVANPNVNVSGNPNVNSVSNVNIALNSNSSSNTNYAANVNTSNNANFDTSDWKSYDSAAFGYAIRYPDDWELSEATLLTLNFKPVGKSFTIEGSPTFPVTLSVVHTPYIEYLASISGEKKTSVSINGYSATKVVGYLNSQYYAFELPKNGETLTISESTKQLIDSGSIGVSEAATLSAQFSEILSTISFK